MRKSFLPLNWGLAAGSKIGSGKAWPAPAAAQRTRTLQVYRYDSDLESGPRLDTYRIDADDCGPMVLDALIKIKNEVDPTLTFRRSWRRSCS